MERLENFEKQDIYVDSFNEQTNLFGDFGGDFHGDLGFGGSLGFDDFGNTGERLDASFSLGDGNAAAPASNPLNTDLGVLFAPEIDDPYGNALTMPIDPMAIDYTDNNLAIPQQDDTAAAGGGTGTTLKRKRAGSQPPAAADATKRKRGRPPGSKNKPKHPRTQQNEEAAADIYTFFVQDYGALATNIAQQWLYHGEFVFKSSTQTFTMQVVTNSNPPTLIPVGDPQFGATASQISAYKVDVPFAPTGEMLIDTSSPIYGQLYYVMRLPFTVIIELTGYTRIEDGMLIVTDQEDLKSVLVQALMVELSSVTFHQKLGYSSFMMRAIRYAGVPNKQTYLRRQLATFLVSDLVQSERVLERLREGDDIGSAIFFHSNSRAKTLTIDELGVDIRSLVSLAYAYVGIEIINAFIPSIFGYSVERPWLASPDRLADIKFCIDRFLISKTVHTMWSVSDDFKPPTIDNPKPVPLHDAHYYALPSLVPAYSQSYRINYKDAPFVADAYKKLEDILNVDLYMGRSPMQGDKYVFLPGEYSPAISNKSEPKSENKDAAAFSPHAVRDPFRYPQPGSKYYKVAELLRFVWFSIVPKYERLPEADRDTTELLLDDREALTTQFGAELINFLLISEEQDTLIGYSEIMRLVRVLNTIVSHGFVVDYAKFSKNRTNKASPKSFPITDSLDEVFDIKKKDRGEEADRKKDERDKTVAIFEYLYGSETGFANKYPAFYNPTGIDPADKYFKNKLTWQTGIGDKTKPSIALKMLKPNGPLPHYSLEVIEYNKAVRETRAGPWETQYLFGGLSKVLFSNEHDVFDIPSNAFDIFALLVSGLVVTPSRQNKSRFIIELGAQHRFTEVALTIYMHAIRSGSGKRTLGKEIVTMGTDGDADFIQCLRQMLYRGSFDRDGLLDIYYKRVLLGDDTADAKLASTVVKLMAFVLALGNQLHPNSFNTRILPDLMRFIVAWSFPTDFSGAGESLYFTVFQKLGAFFLPTAQNVQDNPTDAATDTNLDGPLSLHVRNLSPSIEFMHSYQAALGTTLQNIFDQNAMGGDGPLNFSQGNPAPTETQLPWNTLMEKGARDMIYGATVYEGLAFSMVSTSFKWFNLIKSPLEPPNNLVASPSQRLAAADWRYFVGYNEAKTFQLDNAHAAAGLGQGKNDDDDNPGLDLGDIGPLLNPETELTPENRIIATNIIRNMGLYAHQNELELTARLEFLNDLMTQPVTRNDFIILSQQVLGEITAAAKRNAHHVSVLADSSWTTPYESFLGNQIPIDDDDEKGGDKSEMDFDI